MSVYHTFQKRVGAYELRLSKPSPRYVEIIDVRMQGDGCESLRIDIEDARDVHYALGRLIELADKDDAEGKQL